MTCHRQANTYSTMNYEIPQLVPVEEIQQMIFMIQVAHGSEGETYPGHPVAVFYDYAAARAAFDAYENPTAEYRYGQNGIMAYLVGSNVNTYGILSNSRIYGTKTPAENPARLSISRWEEMGRR